MDDRRVASFLAAFYRLAEQEPGLTFGHERNEASLELKAENGSSVHYQTIHSRELEMGTPSAEEVMQLMREVMGRGR